MDITTDYLGLKLRSPLVVGAAAPLTEDLDNLKRMEDAGAAAIVLHSLFEEQLRQERLELHHHLEHGTNSFAEALTYFPEPEILHVDASEYLKHISKAKKIVNYVKKDLFPELCMVRLMILLVFSLYTAKLKLR